MRVTRLLLFTLVALVAMPALADQFPTLARGFEPGKVFEFGEIDSINVYNGNLIITIPIGQRLALNGGLSYGLSLTYNSKVWDVEMAGSVVHADPSARANAGMGWLLSMGRLLGPHDASNNSANFVYESPDGGEHAIDISKAGSTCDSGGCFPIYSKDGSNLRLRKVNSTTLELDTPDGVVRQFFRSGSVWKLTMIHGLASTDFVQITEPSSASQCPSADLIWLIQDSYSRSQYVCFKNKSYAGTNRPMVDRVVTLAPDVASTPQIATYLFEYGSNETISKAFEDNDSSQSRPTTWSVPILHTLKLPDGLTDACGNGDCSTYSFVPYLTGNPGTLKSLTLPTKGTVEYTYEPIGIPSLDFCDNTYENRGFGFGGRTTGVGSRTFKKDSQVLGTWLYQRDLVGGYPAAHDCKEGVYPPAYPTLYDEMVVTVVQPSGDRVRNHFSVFPGNDVDSPTPNTSPAGFTRDNYGSPFGAYDSYQNRYLSQETQKCVAGSCTTIRALYINRENLCPECASRTISQRTWFTDDPANCTSSGATPTCRYTGEDFLPSSYDGFGHYRTVTSTGNLLGALSDVESRTTTTNYNPGAGTTGQIGSVLAVLPTENWIINTFDSKTTLEGSVQAKEQFCFDRTNGFLKAQRVLAGSTPQGTDLLTVFVQHSTEGNLQTEKYYGGDFQPLTGSAATTTDVCAAAASPTPLGYQVDHTWLRGVETVVKHSGVDFKDKEVTIDSIGFVASLKDTSELVTSSTYDRLGRLKSVTPPGEAATTLTYRAASLSGSTLTPANAVLEKGSGTNTMKAEYQYDLFGRLFREKRWMPGSKWSLREIKTDVMGRKTSESEWHELTGTDENAFTPPLGTEFRSFDAVGRVGSIHTPDGNDTTFTYTGARFTDRTVTGLATSPVSNVTTREVSDSFGRLASVTENYGGASPVLTTYTYDVRGNLATVCANRAGSNCGQQRSFTHDLRGLMGSESHPENGTFSYTYDSRGHIRTRTRSDTTAFNLQYDYDSAERVKEIDFWRNGAFTALKKFTYDGPVNHGKGKLYEALRFNYLPDGLYLVDEFFDYNDSAGHLTDTVTAVVVPGGNSRFVLQGQTYTDLGLPLQTTYPWCDACGASQWSSVTNSYDSGFFKAVTTSNNDEITSVFSPVTYWPNGMVHTLMHGNGVVDTVSIDTNTMMGRPTSISFGQFAGCTGAAISVQPVTGPVNGSNVRTFTVGATGTGFIWTQWYDATTLQPIAGATGTTFTTPQLFADKSYYVVVYNACGRAQSITVTATVCSAPSISTNPSNQSLSGGTATFHVAANGASLSYQWYRGVAPDASIPVGTNSDTYQTPTLSQSTPYWVKVSGCSTSTNSTTAWAVASLAAPTQVVATAGSTTQVTVTWSGVSAATAYRVERLSNGGSWGVVTTVGATSFSDSPLSPNTTYLYRVVAIDNAPANASSPSNINLASTVAFSSIVANGRVTAAPFNELLVAVNAVLAASGHASVQWANILLPAGAGQPPAPGMAVRVLGEHLNALRRAMTTAYGYLNLTPPSYTDPNLPAGPVKIKAVHITELQGAAR